MHTALKLWTAILPLFALSGQVFASGSEPSEASGIRSNSLNMLDEIIGSTQTGVVVTDWDMGGNGMLGNAANTLPVYDENETTLIFTGVTTTDPIKPGRVDAVDGAIGYSGSMSAIELIRNGGAVLRQDGNLAQACTDACSPDSVSTIIIQPKGEEGKPTPAPIVVEVNSTELLAIAGVSAAADGATTSNLQQAISSQVTPEQALDAAALADYMTGNLSDQADATLWAAIGSGTKGEATRSGDVNFQDALKNGSPIDVAAARIDLINSLVDEYKSQFGVSDSEALEMAQNYMDTAYDRPIQNGGGGIFDLDGISEVNASQYGNISAIDDLLVSGDYSLDFNLLSDLVDGGLLDGQLGQGGAGDFVSPGQLSGEVNSGVLAGSGIGSGLDYSNTDIPAFDLGTVQTIGGSGSGGVISTTTTGTQGGDYYSGAITTGQSGSGSDGSLDWVKEIALPSTDMIYVSLKRMFGGPIETIYQSVVDPSSGKFKEAQGEFSKSAMPPTASAFVITSLLWIVLVFSALVVVYIFIYGMYRTAKDGQIMGKEWSAVWVPGRAIISTISVMPIPVVGNFSAIQVFVVMCALLGTAFASTIAAVGFSMLLTQPVIEPVPKEKDGFVANVAKAHLCLDLNEKHGILNPGTGKTSYSYIDSSGKIQGDGFSEDVYSTELVEQEGFINRVLKWFGKATPKDEAGHLQIAEIYNKSKIDPTRYAINVIHFGPRGICGVAYFPVNPAEVLVPKREILDNIDGYEGAGVSVSVATDATKGSLMSEVESSVNKDGSKGDTIVTTLGATTKKNEEWRNNIAAARDAQMLLAFRVLDAQVDKAIGQYLSPVDTDSPDAGANTSVPAEVLLSSALTFANKDFYSNLIALTQKALQNNKDESTVVAEKTVRELGWFSLGTMYWVIEKRQVALMELFDYSNLVFMHGDVTVTDSQIRKYKDDAELAHVGKLIDRSIGATGVKFAAQAFQDAERGIDIDGSSVINSFIAPLLRLDSFSDIDNFNISPIERVRHFGVVYTDTYIAAILGMSLFKGTADTIKDREVPFLSTAAKFMSSILENIIPLFLKAGESIFVGAFICANILPALPYVMLMAAAVGYLIYVVEALIGANWWMLMASHPDGHDVWGRGGAGFPIVLTLILRPSLIVVGFFLGVTFNWVVGHWINVTILPAHNIQNAGSGWLHITQLGGLLLVFSGLHLFAAYKSFSLTWELPNAILRWMGIQDHQDLGEREGKDNIMALGMPGGRSMAPALAGKAPSDKPDKKGNGNGGGEGGEGGEGDKNNDGGGDNNGGGQTDPNAGSTPPSGPAVAPGEGASGKPKGVD